MLNLASPAVHPHSLTPKAPNGLPVFTLPVLPSTKKRGKKQTQQALASGRQTLQSHWQSPLQTQGMVSRKQAVRRVVQRLRKQHTLCATTQGFLQLFHLHAEELLEAGLPYEAVKSLERQGFLANSFI